MQPKFLKDNLKQRKSGILQCQILRIPIFEFAKHKKDIITL